MNTAHKLLDIILGELGSFRGKTLDNMTEDDKIEALGYIISHAYHHATNSRHAQEKRITEFGARI